MPTSRSLERSEEDVLLPEPVVDAANIANNASGVDSCDRKEAEVMIEIAVRENGAARRRALSHGSSADITLNLREHVRRAVHEHRGADAGAGDGERVLRPPRRNAANLHAPTDRLRTRNSKRGPPPAADPAANAHHASVSFRALTRRWERSAYHERRIERIGLVGADLPIYPGDRQVRASRSRSWRSLVLPSVYSTPFRARGALPERRKALHTGRTESGAPTTTPARTLL